MIIGAILFVRLGLVNVTQPIRTSLWLTFISKNSVHIYNSLIRIINPVIGWAEDYLHYCILTKGIIDNIIMKQNKKIQS